MSSIYIYIFFLTSFCFIKGHLGQAVLTSLSVNNSITRSCLQVWPLLWNQQEGAVDLSTPWAAQDLQRGGRYRRTTRGSVCCCFCRSLTGRWPSTTFSDTRKEGPSLLLVLKWGGELTPAGRVQAEELGRAFRCMYPGGQGNTHRQTSMTGAKHFSTLQCHRLCPGDYAGFPGCGLLRLHSTYRHDLKIYASDEGRVQMTAAAFAKVCRAAQSRCVPSVAAGGYMLFRLSDHLGRNGLHLICSFTPGNPKCFTKRLSLIHSLTLAAAMQGTAVAQG